MPFHCHTPRSEFPASFRDAAWTSDWCGFSYGAMHSCIAPTFVSFPLFSMADSKNAESLKPVQKYRLRGISVSIFANPVKSNGEDTVFHKVSIQRAYRDGDEFRTTSSFGRDDLPVVELLTRRAWEFIHDAESSRDS